MASWSAIKAGEKDEEGEMLVAAAIRCAEGLLPREQLDICPLMGSSE